MYDISNFNASYAYTSLYHHDFNTVIDLEKSYNLTLAYNFSDKPKYYTPFEKVIKK